MNPFILESVAEPVNPLLDSLDESFESNASIKLHGCPGELANFNLLWRTTACILIRSARLSCLISII
jgi:hypothetical protein